MAAKGQGLIPMDGTRIDHERLEELVDTLGAVVWEFDWSSGRFTYVSKAAERLLGYPCERWLEPDFWSHHLHADDAEQAAYYCLEATKQGLDHAFEYRMIHADGHPVWVRDVVSVDPVLRDKGRIRGLLIDISTEKCAVEHAVWVENSVTALLSHSGLLAVAVGEDGKIIFANETVEHMLGVERGDLVGTPVWQALHPLDKEWVEALHQAADLSCLDSEITMQAYDGTGRLRTLVGQLVPLSRASMKSAFVVAYDITEREELTARFAQQANEFDAVFALLRDLYFRVDKDGTYLDYKAPANDGALYTRPEQFLGRRMVDILPKHLGEALQRKTVAAIESGEMTKLRYSLDLNGRTTNWEARILPLGHEEASIICRDVTEDQQRERALAESETRYRTLVETLDVGVVVVGADGMIQMTNRAIQLLFGRSAEEFIGRHISELHPRKEDHEGFIAGAVPTLASGGTYITETTLMRTDGTLFDAEVSLRNLDPKTGTRLGTIRDITERKTAERLLLESEESFRSLVDRSPLGVLLYQLDPTGELRVTGMNPASETLLGHPASLFIGKPLEAAFPQLAGTEIEAAYHRIAREGGTYHADLVSYEDELISGAFEVTAFSTGPRRMAVMFSDVTERRIAALRERHHRERLRALTTELASAEDRERRRLAEELHDRVSQSLAAARIRLRQAETLGVGEGQEDVSRATRLIEGAIAETRAITTELFPPVLYELGMSAAIHWLCDELERVHGISCERCIDDVECGSDDCKTVMFRAARELLANIAKHAQSPVAYVALKDEGPLVSLTVSDEGVGFDPERVTGASGESGFGLFSIRERLPHVGGTIDVESAPGAGTSVHITVPRSPAKGD